MYELQSAMMDTVIKLFLLFLLAVFNGFESLNFFEFVQLYWIVNCFFTIVWRFYSIETVKMDFLCA